MIVRAQRALQLKCSLFSRRMVVLQPPIGQKHKRQMANNSRGKLDVANEKKNCKIAASRCTLDTGLARLRTT